VWVLPKLNSFPRRPDYPHGDTSVQQASAEEHRFLPTNALAQRQGINIWEDSKLPDRDHQSAKDNNREEAESPGWSWFNVLVHE
jgi:hypothetical protein